MEDFEREKEQFVENELGQKVVAPKVARGWDEWAGDGISENIYIKRRERAE
jgi:U3 small nucleolar RNA-associated protein 14